MILESLAIIGATSYFFLPHTIENTKVVEVYCSRLKMIIATGHENIEKCLENTVIIDKYPKCLKISEHVPLDIGERLNWIKYRYGWTDPCDYVIDYQTNRPCHHP